ncbi:DUF1648 domain-containing protein [Streptomyces sp. NBC_00299]|uniref:DUF1648 domain-containing protein n=1 Tax=Streptomyces sp. NBC_00299 TaxID=2975705 RepID=UPI002E27FB31|nr:DUF1648 domain-containing protein [Streptomyces sp. NBC_00299]
MRDYLRLQDLNFDVVEPEQAYAVLGQFIREQEAAAEEAENATTDTEGTDAHVVESGSVRRPHPPRRLGGRAVRRRGVATGIAFLLLRESFPDKVATHFTVDGRADGYSSLAAAFGLYMLVFVIEAVARSPQASLPEGP